MGRSKHSMRKTATNEQQSNLQQIVDDLKCKNNALNEQNESNLISLDNKMKEIQAMNEKIDALSQKTANNEALNKKLEEQRIESMEHMKKIEALTADLQKSALVVSEYEKEKKQRNEQLETLQMELNKTLNEKDELNET